MLTCASTKTRRIRSASQPSYPDPYTPYPEAPAPGGSTGSGAGLSGLINKASTAVAGLGLATGVTGLLGSLAGGGVRKYPKMRPSMPTSNSVLYIYHNTFTFSSFLSY